MQKIPRSSQLIGRVLKSGQRSFGRFVCFSFLRRRPGFVRIVISTKISKKATVRNRLRRIVREYLRSRVPEDIQLVVTFKRVPAEQLPSPQQLRQDLDGCLNKLKV